MTEVIGFVIFPCLLFLLGIKRSHMMTIRIASVLTLLGIILNRLNISLIAFKWFESVKYVPSWIEVEVTLAVILAEVIVFRWIVNRMPVLSPSPTWAESHENQRRIKSDIDMEELVEWKASAI